MTQAELNAVAEATGEDVSTIQQRGFSLVTFGDEAFDFADEGFPDPQVCDFDSPFVGATQSFYECC